MTEEQLEKYKTKKKFIESFNPIFKEYPQYLYIEDIKYEVFEAENAIREIINEFLVVTYRGGALGVKNCNYNSISVIFKELANMLDGGCYYDVNTYLYQKENFKKII